jgi:hypothetical protein
MGDNRRSKPQFFQHGRPEPGRRFGSHGLGRGQLDRLTHRPEDTQKGRGGAGGQGQEEGEPVRPEDEVRELEEAAIYFNHALAQPQTDDGADHGGYNHRRQGELKIMPAHGRGGIAEGF